MTDVKAVTKMIQANWAEQRQTEAVAVESDLPPWNLAQQAEDVREAFHGLEILWKEKEKRVQILQTLSNPWPGVKQSRPHHERKTPSFTRMQLPEAIATPISHTTFRQNLANAVDTGDKAIRQVLRAQLLRCQVPNDIRKIIATALITHTKTQVHLAALHEPLVRSLYRCRERVTDTEVLQLLNSMKARYKVYGIPFNTQLLALGLKFAARTRSLAGMKKYLKALSRNRKDVTSNVFRATIAKFSIGHRGLGEIRNGRWRRDELLQVLTGFDDCAHLPVDEQYHLETFLDRSDWQYLHGWIAALARCKDAEAVWREWQMWKESAERRRPKNLNVPASTRGVTTKTRGDYWFIEQMSYAGGLEYAWRIVEETNTEFGTMKDRIKTRLLEGIEHISPAYWVKHKATIRAELLRKCEIDLVKIEKALGVAWVTTNLDDEGQGYHVLVQKQEDVLDRLGAKGFKIEEDFGYPYDGIVPPRERSLHAADVVEG